MKAVISDESSLNREKINHQLDVVLCEIKQIKLHINNADKKALTNYDFEIAYNNIQNLIALSNMLKVEIYKL